MTTVFIIPQQVLRNNHSNCLPNPTHTNIETYKDNIENIKRARKTQLHSARESMFQVYVTGCPFFCINLLLFVQYNANSDICQYRVNNV